MIYPKLRRAKRTGKVGIPPGSILYTGAPRTEKPEINLISYSQQEVTTFYSDKLSDISLKLDSESVHWINISSLHDVELIKQIGEHFNIHNLTLEDIVNIDHPPKAEDFDTFFFLTLKLVKQSKENGLDVEHFSFVLQDNVLITFQERLGDPFNNIRDRIQKNLGKARGRDASYLLFLLLDAAIDQYLLLIEKIDERIGDIEEKIIEDPEQAVVSSIISERKYISQLFQLVIPLRDAIKEVLNGEVKQVSESWRVYYTDALDHVKQLTDTLQNQREMLVSLMEFYSSQVSTQMNKVMQTLTIIATIFIPLTFLAGIYGMNFQYMPELAWKWSYPLLLGIMLVTGIGMWIYMKRKNWF